MTEKIEKEMAESDFTMVEGIEERAFIRSKVLEKKEGQEQLKIFSLE
jgi:hypothetical protein